jgi:hypothetical protein
LKAGELESLHESFRAHEDPRRGHVLHHRVASTVACAAAATLLRVILHDAIEHALSERYPRIVNAIMVAPEHGEDSLLYGAIGYVVRSAKQPGPSRVKKTEPGTVLAE